jgi:hypothetical protein
MPGLSIVWIIYILVIRYCFEFRTSIFEFQMPKSCHPLAPFRGLPEATRYAGGASLLPKSTVAGQIRRL